MRSVSRLLLAVCMLLVGAARAQEAPPKQPAPRAGEPQHGLLTEASRRMARTLDGPLTIEACFSKKLPERYLPFSDLVFAMLEEYEAASGGKIKVRRFDPEGAPEAKHTADKYGIRPVQLPVFAAASVRVVNAYGGIVLVCREQVSDVIDVASRYLRGYDGLAVLEYDITSRLWQLLHPRPKLGIAGYLARDAQPDFEGLRLLLGESYELETVDLEQRDLDPKQVPVLLFVRPREMSAVEVFRLDQFVMKGGRLLLFITQGTIEVAPSGDGGWSYRPFKSGLDEWLRVQGIAIPNEFVMHRMSALPVEVRAEVLPGVEGPMQVPNWFWPWVKEDSSLDPVNPAVQPLDHVALFWPHPVDILEDKVGADKRATVLVRSHAEESWRWKDLGRVDIRDIHRQGENPPSFSSLPLVVALEGTFHSYYADHPAPSLLGGPADEAKPAVPHVAKSTAEPTCVVIVGNSIFVSDAVLRGQEADADARQAALLAFNLVDWLVRSRDLAGLHAQRYDGRALVERTRSEPDDTGRRE